MSDGRPPKVPKITQPAQEQETLQPKEDTPDAQALERKEDTPDAQALGLEFDRACQEISKLLTNRATMKKWKEFFDSTPATLVLKSAYLDMRQNMIDVDKSTAQLWERQCTMQMLLERLVIEQYCSQICTNEKSQAYLEGIFSALDKHDIHCNSISIAVCTDVLFRRLAATFGSSPYKDMEKWFHAIPARSFDVKGAKRTHKISNAAEKVAEIYGVPCIMFAMCVYLAALGLDDATLDGTLWDMFKPIVFFNQKTSDDVDDLHYDFLILKLAVLDRLEWKTHVSVGSYAARVKDMPGVPEKQKDEIVKMFASEDESHKAKFGEFLQLSFHGSCYQDENGEWKYDDKHVSIVSSPALHQKVHFVAPHPDYDFAEDFYGTITGYTAPNLFDIEGHNYASEERKLMKVKLPYLHLYLVVRPPSARAALRADPRVFQRVGSSKY